ncbi:MAG: hypothetical protein K8T20_18860 [Planctomycetes bacterium]|nr:hypothetical protein [Planctomycetota bacterium]
MRITREETAPDREAWEKDAHERAMGKGYAQAGPMEFRRGNAGAFHPDVWRHTVTARWDGGRGIWEASAFGRSPATRRFLEARLDDLQGKAVPGSGLTTLGRAAASGLLAWLLAAAVLLIFTVPLCRDARHDWAEKQAYFEQRLETHRAPIQKRVLEAPVLPAALIPAAALAFLAAIPLCLLFALGELVPQISRWNLPALITACIVLPMSLISPGAAVPGLFAGILAPLAAWAAYAGIRAFAACGRAPAHGPRWAAGFALVAVVAAIPALPAVALQGSDLYIGARDRLLYGTKPGEALATFYYRHTPLSAYALRRPDDNARNTILFAGSAPAGFPTKQFHFLEYPAVNKEEFLRLARTGVFTLLVYNEDAGPWVVEAAQELKRERPSRALEFIAVSKGGLEKVFPEAAPEQFLDAELLRRGADPSRVTKFNAALSEAYDRADRRRSLRDVARMANSLAIFLGPVLLLGAWGVWVAGGVVWLKRQGLRRAAGALAVAAVIVPLGLGWKVATAEGDIQKKLRDTRAEFESLRAAVSVNPAKQADLDAAAARAMPDLKLLAVHPEVSVRVLAMDALGASASVAAYKTLGECVLNDSSILVRYRAADAIGRSLSKNQRVALLSNAQDDEIYVAEAALDAMMEYHK